MNLTEKELNIFDFGFDKLLNKVDFLDSPTPLMANKIDSEVVPTLMGSGEMLGNYVIKDGHLQSSNFVSGSAGWQLTPTSAELNVATAVKELAIGTSPDWFKCDTTGNIWSGNATLAGAKTNNFAVEKEGLLYCQGATIGGAAISTPTITGIQSGSEIAIQGWTQDMAFSSTDYRIVAWASGTITLLDGTTYNITGANTGNMSALTYIYLDIGTSITLLQHTTTPATAVGSGKILIAVAQNNSDTTSKATLQVFGGKGGQMVAIDNLVANSASTNELISNTAQIKDAVITNAKITTLDTSKITTGILVVARTQAKCTDASADQTSAHTSANAAAYTGASISTTYTAAKCTDAAADETATHQAATIASQGSLATQNTVGAGDCDTTIIDGGVIITGLLQGATLRTAASGARVVIDSTGIKQYDATTQRAQILNDGSGWLGSATTLRWTAAGVINLTWANVDGAGKPDNDADVTSAHDCQHPGDYTASHDCAHPGDYTLDATAITDAHISSINFSNITASNISATNITAGTLTGRIVRTAASGKRIELSTSGNSITVYNTGGNLGLSIYDAEIWGGWSNSNIDFDIAYGVKIGFPFPGADPGYISFKRNLAGDSGASAPIISGSTGFQINAYSASHWLPYASGSYNLGSTSKKWQNLYLSNHIYIDNDIYPNSDNASSSLGFSTRYFHQLFADLVRWKTSQAFQKHDDIALIKNIKMKKVKVQTPNTQKIKGKMVEKEIWDEKTFPKDVCPDGFFDAGAVNGLLVGTIKQLISRIEQLEANVG